MQKWHQQPPHTSYSPWIDLSDPYQIDLEQNDHNQSAPIKLWQHDSITILNRWWVWVWWNDAMTRSATTTYLLLTMDWFVRSVPNWLGTEWAQLVSTNQTMTAWFYNNIKQVMSVSLVELCNNSISNHHIPPTHHQMFFWILTKLTWNTMITTSQHQSNYESMIL
jgi:hypothetical protein